MAITFGSMEYMDKSIFRAYDIRGVYGADWDERDAYRVGRAIFQYASPTKVAVGYDARLSAPAVHAAVCRALVDSGAEVVNLGMIASDMATFAAGALSFDLAISVTASHNPKEWIGMKLTKAGGLPIGGDGEIQEIGEIVMAGDWSVPEDLGLPEISSRDILPLWINHVLKFVDPATIKPFRVVVDAGNGVAGRVVRALAEKLPIEIIEMYFEPDGNFPNHLPSPIEPENTADLRKRVIEERAGMGMAFDGDADRVFLVDETGRLVTGSELTAMVMDEVLSQDPTRTVLYNAICGWNVRDVVAKHQATAYRTKVGHGYIKRDMKKYDAYFAGEHSGHYFFGENFGGDSGLIAAVVALSLISKRDQALSEILAEHRKYVQIPETNFRVTDGQLVVDKIEERFAGQTGITVDHLDGLTISAMDWWANIRMSSNEPLLRLNVEAKSESILDRQVEELREIIEQE